MDHIPVTGLGEAESYRCPVEVWLHTYPSFCTGFLICKVGQITVPRVIKLL